jgi:hypothetical protein
MKSFPQHISAKVHSCNSAKVNDSLYRCNTSKSFQEAREKKRICHEGDINCDLALRFLFARTRRGDTLIRAQCVCASPRASLHALKIPASRKFTSAANSHCPKFTSGTNSCLPQIHVCRNLRLLQIKMTREWQTTFAIEVTQVKQLLSG